MKPMERSAKLRYLFRLLALACATFCGIIFLIESSILAWIYYHSHYRLPLFITYKSLAEYGLFGLGLLCSGFGYWILAQTKPE